MGQIIRLPIVIITDKSNESRYGITPQLVSTIRNLANAETTQVGSKKAIRDAINSLNVQVSGLSIGSGIPVFNSISGDNIVYYNSVSGLGNVVVSGTSDNIFLDTTQAGAVSGEVVLSRTLNGGIEQEASKINYSNFDSLSTMEAFHDVKSGDVIGKIVIKCTEAFDSDSTQYSIGTSLDNEGYVRKFNAPTTISTNSNNLVDFTYGTFLNDKVEYVTSLGSVDITSSIEAGDDIKVYKWGSSNLSGEMQCVIFYDKSGEYGIFPGGNPVVAAVGKVYRSSEVDTFNINNSTSSRSILSLTIPREDMASMQNSSYLWLAGGYNWIDYTGGGRAPQGELNSIEKIKLPTQTSDVIVNTITSVMFANTAVNIRGLYGYMFGGVIDYYNGTNTNVIQKFTMSTETTVDTGQNTSNLAGGLVVVTEFANQSNCWLMGGINVNSSVNIYYNNIDKFNTVTDTNNTSFALVLNDSLAKGNSASSITHGYFIGGDDGVSSGTSDIQRFSYSDTTGTISDRALIPFGSYGGASIIDNNHENVYIYGGNPVIKNVITKYNLTNDTINATVVGSTTREIFQSGHGKV